MRRWAVMALAFVLLLGGCATNPSSASARRFDFSQDSFAYPNELVWEYRFDDKGNWHGTRREPPPAYALHC
ncbi:MAG TPA: hypothetical protein VHH73_13200, partial [Verrucomicrobiae bacterium]|nr:hypothetical protein [Verrucomicrobiae bacterium]